MKIPNSRWQFATTLGSEIVSAPSVFRLGKVGTSSDTPVSQQVITWLLFWPILTLIAHGPVYFSGPARTARAFQDGAAGGGPATSPYPQYIYLLFLAAFVVVGHQQVWTKLKRNPLIPAMLTLAVLSALWSPVPSTTLKMCVQVGLCTLFACYLSERLTTERLMELLIFMGVVSAVSSILFALALPAYGIFQGYGGGAWQGICDHKNTLGFSIAFLLTPIFFANAYSRERKVIYSALLLFLIYKSQSRGAWADTAGTLLFVAWLRLIRLVRERELALVLLLTASVVIPAAALGIHFWPMLAASMGKDPTMTGRTLIYTEVWRSIIKHPVFGYGFGSFWTSQNPEFQRICIAIRWPNIGYAESGILEVALQTGFVGVGLLLAMIAKAVLQGARLLRSTHYSPCVGWYLTVLFLVALTNIDAGLFMTPDTVEWVLILVSCVGLNEEARRHSERAYSFSGSQ